MKANLVDFFHSNSTFSDFTELILFVCWVPVAPQDIKHIESNRTNEVPDTCIWSESSSHNLLHGSAARISHSIVALCCTQSNGHSSGEQGTTHYASNIHIKQPLQCILCGKFLVVLKAPAEIPNTEQLKVWDTQLTFEIWN